MQLNTRELALLSVLTALCVSIQITPRPPNIEFTSLICFITGFVFGSKFGASLGALTMFINGFLSPSGFAGIIMPFQMVGMMIMGLVGGVYKRSLRGNPCSSRLVRVEVAFLVAFLTLVYDLLTNVGYSIMFGKYVIVAFATGVPLTIVHVVSNTALFGTVFFGLVRVINNLLGEKIWSYQKGAW